MTKEYVWKLDDVIASHPLSNDKEMELSFMAHGKFASVNVAQVHETVKAHQHVDHDEIIYILRGRHQLTVEDKVYEVEPGDLIVVPCGITHEIKCGEGYAALSIYAPGWDEKMPDRVLIESKE